MKKLFLTILLGLGLITSAYGAARTSLVNGAGETAIFEEDAAHASTDSGIMSLGVRNDALAALGGTDGDYAPLQLNDIGALFVTGEHIEDEAHASGDYGNLPLAVRNDTLAALGATDGDYVPLQVNADGALFTAPASVTGVVATADGVIKASAGVLYAIYVSFDGVTAGDTIEIENDGTDNDGTSLCTIVAQAGDENVSFTPPVGITYSIGLYMDETLSGGDATVTLVYK